MLIILDLDNTLLDTGRLKEGLSKALNNFGISQKLFWQVYKKLRKKSFYNHKIYLEYLSKEKRVDLKKCSEALKNLDNKIKDFLYPDALSFLRKMREGGIKLILLTWGDKKFQKIKIEETKIKGFFDQIIITEKTKLPYLAKIIKRTKEKIVFLNDEPAELQAATERFKDIAVLQMKRKGHDREVQDLRLPGVPIFSNLKEVEKWIRSKL